MIQEQSLGPVGHPRYRDYAKDINLSGKHLLGIINDILDVTRVESGEVRLDESEVDIAACVASTLRALAPLLAATRLDVEVDIASAPRLVADRRLVEQILLNLASNAIKFTPVGGGMAITARRRGDGGVALGVADTGIGIAESELPKLGRPFEQVDQSHTRKFGGAGLGLTIVRGMVELHGGTMTIASKPGQGTTVTCDFPPARTADRAGAAA